MKTQLMNWQNAALETAGIIGSSVAVYHGVLVQRLMVRPVEAFFLAENDILIGRLVAPLLHLSTVSWFFGGVTLIAAANWFEQDARLVTGALVGGLYLYGAVGNLWATRGLHPGWMLMVVALILIVLGVSKAAAGDLEAAPPDMATAPAGALAQVPAMEDAVSGEDLPLIAREEAYEISLPAGWSKRQLSDGGWILYSTRTPETLRVRAHLYRERRESVKDPAFVATTASDALADGMSEHDILQAEWEGTVFSITATGSSLPHKSLLAYRVIANDMKMVWALHELSLQGASFVGKPRTIKADATMDEHRLAILRSLKLR